MAISVDDPIQMILNYKNHFNQLRYQGKPFFSAWQGARDAWWPDNGEINTSMGWQTVFGRFVGRNNIFFVPFFSGTGGTSVAFVDYVPIKVVIAHPRNDCNVYTNCSCCREHHTLRTPWFCVQVALNELTCG